VCGCSRKPFSSRSLSVFRTVAGLIPSRYRFARILDPVGFAVAWCAAATYLQAAEASLARAGAL